MPETANSIKNSESTTCLLPLIVNLDDMLIKCNLLLESSILLIKHSIFNIFIILKWLLTDRVLFKEKISELISIDTEKLPYNRSVIDFLTAEYKNGRKIILISVSPIKYAQKIADYLGLFSSVIITSTKFNPEDINKPEKKLVDCVKNGFEYVCYSNNSSSFLIKRYNDYTVNNSIPPKNDVHQTVNIVYTKNESNSGILKYFKAIRVYQWSKNFLLFVPLITSHNISKTDMLIRCIFGFLAFNFCASSTYILNDIFDTESDRKHPRKKNRVFARGDISVSNGLVIAMIMTVSGISLSLFLSINFTLLVLSYIILTFFYSLFLKKKAMIDVITLAILYSIRIFGGAQLINVDVSFWLFAFSIFIFLGLALIKRCTELQVISHTSTDAPLFGRDYDINDLQTLRSIGITSSFISIVVFALYINSTEVLSLYSYPKFMWAICPALLLWINRLWIKTSRCLMHDDPLIFTFKDIPSQLLILFMIVIVIIAN